MAQWTHPGIYRSDADHSTVFFTTQDTFTLGVTAEQVSDQCEIDDNAALEFLLVGYVTGNETLYRDVRQIQSGQMIEFHPNVGSAPIREHRYYRFYPNAQSTASESQLEEELEHVLNASFTAFRSSCNANRIVVPLSGGLDSRLVAGMLKKQGFENVLCFTYGRPDDEETVISKAVADALGYDWHFEAYTSANA